MPGQAAPPPHLPDLAERLHSSAVRLLRRLRRADAATGLSGPRLSLLSVLVYRGPSTITELARAEQVRPPTVSRMVKDMEYDGLVARRGDPNDGRVQRIRATAAGRRLLHRGRRERVRLLADGLAELPAPDVEVLVRAVGMLEALNA